MIRRRDRSAWAPTISKAPPRELPEIDRPWFRAWLLALLSDSSRSLHTRYSYACVAKQWCRWAAQHGVSVRSASPEQIATWVREARNRSTLGNREAALRDLYAFALAHGYRADDPTLASRHLRKDRGTPQRELDAKRPLERASIPARRELVVFERMDIVELEFALTARLLRDTGASLPQVWGLRVGDVHPVEQGVSTTHVACARVPKGRSAELPRAPYGLHLDTLACYLELRARREEIAAPGEDVLLAPLLYRGPKPLSRCAVWKRFLARFRVSSVELLRGKTSRGKEIPVKKKASAKQAAPAAATATEPAQSREAPRDAWLSAYVSGFEPLSPKLVAWMRSQGTKYRQLLAQYPPGCVVRAVDDESHESELPEQGVAAVLVSPLPDCTRASLRATPHAVRIVNAPLKSLRVVGYHAGRSSEYVEHVLRGGDPTVHPDMLGAVPDAHAESYALSP